MVRSGCPPPHNRPQNVQPSSLPPRWGCSRRCPSVGFASPSAWSRPPLSLLLSPSLIGLTASAPSPLFEGRGTPRQHSSRTRCHQIINAHGIGFWKKTAALTPEASQRHLPDNIPPPQAQSCNSSSPDLPAGSGPGHTSFRSDCFMPAQCLPLGGGGAAQSGLIPSSNTQRTQNVCTEGNVHPECWISPRSTGSTLEPRNL